MSFSVRSVESITVEGVLGHQQNSLQDFSILDGNSIEKRQVACSNLAANAVSLAYGINRPAFALKDSSINGGLLADTHWEVLNYSHDVEETNQYGFKAVTFINRHTHEIHMASAGTVADRHDILDDLLLTCGRIPYKLQLLKGWVDEVVQKLGGADLAKAYQFSTSGHSLGAVVADLTGLEIASRGLSLVSSTTFENPGSEKAIQAVLDNQGFSGKIDSGQLAKLRQCYTVYNAKPNLINTTQPQFADHCNLVLPPKHAHGESAKASQHSLWSFGQYLYGLVGSAVDTCASYLGFNHLVQLKEDHGLRHFQALEQAAVIPVDQWLSRWNWKDPLLVKSVSPELFKALSTQSPSGNELFFEEEDSDLSLVKIQGANFRDVQAAVAHQKAFSQENDITTVPGSRSVNFLPGKPGGAAIALAQGYLQDESFFQEAADLGYESDFSLCHDQTIDEACKHSTFQGCKPCSDAALRQHISALSHQDATAIGSTDSSRGGYPNHSYPTMIVL